MREGGEEGRWLLLHYSELQRELSSVPVGIGGGAEHHLSNVVVALIPLVIFSCGLEFNLQQMSHAMRSSRTSVGIPAAHCA